ncbi:ferritin light chain, oocyte isoform-like [Sarcophilus harrisii]|uniref:Ferritin n=1 Tax=Sarcophilus harrisii TaxID=9305 RepID=A0A7N4NS04_SARHA|nr:ferritin light chain, oocyte isoform-like [Sarcophilus harrisii]
MAASMPQSLHPEIEILLNKIINMELRASYVYFSVTYCFSHEDTTLKHFINFSRDISEKKKQHAETFLQFLIKRGGCPVLENIIKPEMSNWLDGLHALQEGLAMEKTINENLLQLYDKAKHKDPHLSNFLDSEFLEEQVKIIRLFGEHITKLKRLGLADKC